MVPTPLINTIVGLLGPQTLNYFCHPTTPPLTQKTLLRSCFKGEFLHSMYFFIPLNLEFVPPAFAGDK